MRQRFAGSADVSSAMSTKCENWMRCEQLSGCAAVRTRRPRSQHYIDHLFPSPFSQREKGAESKAHGSRFFRLD